MRLDGTVTDERLHHALAGAILEVNMDGPVQAWATARAAEGETKLEDVKASTPMIGFDADGVHREFGLGKDEVPVMLLAVGAERTGNWPQKPRMPVAEVLDLV